MPDAGNSAFGISLVSGAGVKGDEGGGGVDG